MDEPRVLWLVSQQDGQPVGPVLWRVFFPMQQLQARGYTAEFAWQPRSDADLALLSAAVAAYRIDTVVLPRVYWRDPADGRQLVERLHSAGICAVYEADDDMFLHLDEVKRGTPELAEVALYREQRIAALRLCDGALVSTPALATVVRSLTDKPVAVCPNTIDLDWWYRASAGAARTIPHPTIGWAGGRRQEEDLAPMLAAWGRIARRFPRAHFVVAGWEPPSLRALVPPGRLHVLPWLPLEEFPRSYVEIDIACCAVAPGLFNRAKSPIKAIEAGASGCAVVATPFLYRQVIAHGENGWLAETADEWEHALAMLLAAPSWRRQLAWRLTRTVERDWSYNDPDRALRWLDALTTIRNRYLLTRGVAA